MLVAKEFDIDTVDWERVMDNMVVLTIDLSKCSNVDLETDPNSMPYQHFMILSGTIPPNSIVNVESVYEILDHQ